MTKDNEQTGVPTGFGRTSEEVRARLAELILRHASEDGELDTAETFHVLKEVTQRSYSTIKNWVHYGNGWPDAEALIKILSRWPMIGVDAIYQSGHAAEFVALFRARGEELSSAGVADAAGAGPAADSLAQLRRRSKQSGSEPQLYTLRPAVRRRRDIDLSMYTKNGQHCVLLEQTRSDAGGVVERGELMLVDTSCEQIDGADFYILATTGSTADSEEMAVRMVVPQIGKATARVSMLGTGTDAQTQELPLTNGQLGLDVRVFGRVVGFLKKR